MQSTTRRSLSNARVFTACLLSMIMLLAPLASFAVPSPDSRSASISTLTWPHNGALLPAIVAADLTLAKKPLVKNGSLALVGSPVITASMMAPATANPGSTITYTANISNATGSTDATGVTFTDTVDPNTTSCPDQ